MRIILLSLLAISLILGACSTVQEQIGKVALKFMTKKEANLSNIAVIGTYQTNVAGPDVAITTLGTEDWEEGENLVGVQLVKPEGAVGVIELDGTVTVDGKEAKSYGGGAYYARFEENDKSSKTINIVSSNGQETEFSIASSPTLSIKSVNGENQDIEINLSEPLELELEYDAQAEGKRVVVSMITNAVGAKGFANFHSTIINNNIVIPAEAFKHKHITGAGPTGKDVTNWVTGSNHLQVSLVETDRSNNGGPFPYFKKESKSFDTIPVSVTGQTDGRSWVRVKGESKEASGNFRYSAQSSNAWYARPLDTNIKRIGISSLSVSGTLYKQEVETSERENYLTGYREIITTTTTFEFPELDDEYWDQFLENIYSDLEEIFSSDFEATIVNVDRITTNPIYDEFYTPEDENTKEYIAKNLRDTKRLIPTKLGEIIADRSTSLIADNSTSAKLLRDMNMDAFMDVIINYQVAGGEDDAIVLLPNVSYRVVGQNQGFDGTTNVWFSGNIQGPGVPFSETEFSDLNALNRIGQKEIITKLIKESLLELSKEQVKYGYQKIWGQALSE
jgi:hypothetical protein